MYVNEGMRTVARGGLRIRCSRTGPDLPVLGIAGAPLVFIALGRYSSRVDIAY
jgi:hypothetical protein